MEQIFDQLRFYVDLAVAELLDHHRPQQVVIRRINGCDGQRLQARLQIFQANIVKRLWGAKSQQNMALPFAHRVEQMKQRRFVAQPPVNILHGDNGRMIARTAQPCLVQLAGGDQLRAAAQAPDIHQMGFAAGLWPQQDLPILTPVWPALNHPQGQSIAFREEEILFAKRRSRRQIKG